VGGRETGHGSLADDRGCIGGVRGGDVSDREGDVADQALSEQPKGSAAGRLVGALSLAVTYVVLAWLIALHCGYVPATSAGIAIGTFVGLGSLVAEIAIIGRSMRGFERNGMGATLQTFTMRLLTVGALGGLFLFVDAVDAEAFCLSYFATFFVYMCWLTWRCYQQPVQYKRKPRATRHVPAKAGGQPLLEGSVL
jgi:hypothetical protein